MSRSFRILSVALLLAAWGGSMVTAEPLTIEGRWRVACRWPGSPTPPLSLRSARVSDAAGRSAVQTCCAVGDRPQRARRTRYNSAAQFRIPRLP